MKKKDTAIIEKAVNNMCRPIIVMDPGWGVPDKVRDLIMLQRLAAARAGEELATEAEAMLYISNASFLAPLDHDWVDIYAYLLTRTGWDNIPRDIIQESISNYQQQMLQRLRAWIYERGMKYVKEGKRASKSKQERAVGGLEACSAGSRTARRAGRVPHGEAERCERSADSISDK